ncbi:hypothetical protein E2C01_015308 [Portunus trituberculatus]|uniref:NACHT domain-containing protein n=1 Tax=Portunus trituberculatus TaxID=210409 RepID=A0A5B7DMD4_PORTR|nr:hypothetical protein [Portunus trituberculatus]
MLELMMEKEHIWDPRIDSSVRQKKRNHRPIQHQLVDNFHFYRELISNKDNYSSHREINVADILTERLNEDDENFPGGVLLLGRPESGKTALFAQILHYWLHDKGKMMGLKKYDFLLAFQCLVLQSHFDGKTTINLEKHMLDHLPKSVEHHGKERVQQEIRKAKVLIIIDSLDCLEERAPEIITSLSSWTDSSVLLFCREYLSKEDIQDNSEMVPFFTHFLMPHYNPEGCIEKMTFRINAHRLFLAAKQAVIEMDLGMKNVNDVLNAEGFKTLQSLLLMVLGVARGSNYFDEIKEQALKIIKANLEDHVTEKFADPIINYAVNVLSETKLFSKTDNDFDDFARKLVDALKPNNWTIVDGNMHPEALRTLCGCGHENKDQDKCKPQRMNIILSGHHTDMPGLHDILIALKDCDMRINFTNDHSFLNEKGEFPLDDVLFALQGKGKAKKKGPSLASFKGYLKNIKMLDTDPATRRIYKISLRICNNNNYEDLRELCKVSHKLRQVTLRISHNTDLNVKKLKELPASIAKLTVCLEGYDDYEVEKAIKIWRSIQGTTQREVKELLFWFTVGKRMTSEGVKKIIQADLPDFYIIGGGGSCHKGGIRRWVKGSTNRHSGLTYEDWRLESEKETMTRQWLELLVSFLSLGRVH